MNTALKTGISRRQNTLLRFVSASILLLATIATSLPATDVCAEDANVAARHFTLKVLPLLTSKCLACHGGDPDDIKGEFSVVTRENLLRGGESGDPAVVPAKPNAGTLINAIKWADLEMPPKENDRLTKPQIEIFSQWIKQGAPWPSEEEQRKFREDELRNSITDAGMIMPTSGGVSNDWTNRRYQPADLWAFLPVGKREELLPREIAAEDAVDFFINRKLKEAGLTASPQADPKTLLRRVTLDLTGLPPTPEENVAFQKAWAKNQQAAWRQTIDRLLASPRYGEHWGRHWLDVTRYADTGGMSNDYERSNMWRYRDYVIRSFNNDKPYNQFVVEQLAGDELADQSVRERLQANDAIVREKQRTGDYTPQEAEWIVASGFLRLGPFDNAMIEPAEAKQIYIDDIVNVTGQTFLATTMRCCKCHDHKFDPLPTRDYYRLYAAFSATHLAERPAPFFPEESQDRIKAGRAHVQRLLDFAVAERDKIITKRETAAKAWFKEHNLPYKNEQQRRNLPDDQKPPRHAGLSQVEQGQLKVREQDERIWRRRLERFEPMAQSVYNSGDANIAYGGARKLRIKPAAQKSNKGPNAFILTGGALTAPGDPVTPGVLSAIGVPASGSKNRPQQAIGSPAVDEYLLTNTVNGRRLGLANWIADPENPLTSRSIVNRIWQHHFGFGLAINPNNFGAKGGKPSHPDLLDYLADDFVTGGWTMKRLHRTILLSQAYRRSATATDLKKVEVADPNNRLLSYYPRRRLSAEELRDGILAITGELQHAGGGLPIMPEINMEVALQPRMIQFSISPAYQPSPTPNERNRRTIFAYTVRGQADPFTELFNQPNPNESCERRETAAVTPQAFSLLNSDFMTDRSIALALRLEREHDSLSDQLGGAFALALGRAPSDAEKNRLAKYATDMQRYHQKIDPNPTAYPQAITRSLVEELTGQPFEYQEILPVFEDYQPDPKPSDVSPATRALADVCLLLFNSNEFIYVD